MSTAANIEQPRGENPAAAGDPPMKAFYLIEIGIEETADGWEWTVDVDFSTWTGIEQSEKEAIAEATALVQARCGQ